MNPSPFASDAVSGVVLRGDSLWVATAKGLYVSRASTGLSAWNLADTAFTNTAMLGLAWDGSTLMTAAGGVAQVFDETDGSWTSRGGIGPVTALSDDRGAILASSDWGVFRWQGGAWVLIPGSSAGVVTTKDAAGRVWAANRAGLSEWSGGAWTLHVPDAPVGNNVQNIALQGTRVYITTFQEGVGRFDGARWRNWPVTDCGSGCDSTFLSSAYAFALLVDQQGWKWVGNYGSAIESFNDDVSPPTFSHHQPPADSVSSRHQHTLALVRRPATRAVAGGSAWTRTTRTRRSGSSTTTRPASTAPTTRRATRPAWCGPCSWTRPAGTCGPGTGRRG